MVGKPMCGINVEVRFVFVFDRCGVFLDCVCVCGFFLFRKNEGIKKNLKNLQPTRHGYENAR